MSGASITQLWSTFYDKAVEVAEEASGDSSDEGGTKTAPIAPSDPQHKQRVVAALDGLVQIVFGLDTNIKAAVVSHGDGALELIVALTRSTDVLRQGGRSVGTERTDADTQILTSSFKAVKACVVRNPVGRSRMRSAGVFELTDEALANNNDAPLVEEILTSLAASCLGDDLNALQASLQLRGHVDRAESLTADGSAGLKQKVAYLRSLFDATVKEYEDLIATISNSQRDFFADIKTAEMGLRSGNLAVQEEKFESALSHYDRTMECVEAESLKSATKLLNSLRCQVYWNRANVRFKLEKTEDALDDLEQLLQNEVPADIKGFAEKLRSKILGALGRDEEAREAAGKALVVDPLDEELQKSLADQKLE